jgi:hypothetical protein
MMEAAGEAGMRDEAGLRAALERLLPRESSRRLEFVVRDGAGRMRIGTLCTDAGCYAEVANFTVAEDYCAAWDGEDGVWRFGCEVDLFYSDLGQTMAMSRQAAEAALGRVEK